MENQELHNRLEELTKQLLKLKQEKKDLNKGYNDSIKEVELEIQAVINELTGAESDASD